MTTVRHTSLLAVILNADPEHTRNSRIVPEYEFSAPGRRGGLTDDKTHEGGLRVFRGDYQKRGPYVPSDLELGPLGRHVSGRGGIGRVSED